MRKAIQVIQVIDVFACFTKGNQWKGTPFEDPPPKWFWGESTRSETLTSQSPCCTWLLHCLHSQFCCLDIVNFATWISFCVGQVPILGEIPSNANRIAFFVSDVPCKSFACMGVYPCFAENCGPTVASFLTNFGGFAGSERRTLSTLPVSHPHFRYLDLEWLRYEFVLDNLTLQHICSSSIPFLDPQDGIPMLY